MRSPSQKALDEGRSPRAPRLPLRWGGALGAAAAALTSAALVYWIGSGEDPTLSSVPHAQAPARVYAPVKPAPDQVIRAYEQLQAIYAERGPSGVTSFARSCAESLSTDPGLLDFCIAFDVFAASLAGEAADAQALLAQADARDLALARAALPPGQDAAARIAAIRELARQASLQTPDEGAQPPPQSTPAPAPDASQTQAARPQASRSAAQAKASDQAVQSKSAKAKSAEAKAAAARTQRLRSEIAACRRRGPAAQRTVCSSPALRQADRRLRLAYQRAVAAGASPRRLARDQASFRSAVWAAAPNRSAIARLYYKRTRTLEALARRSRSSGD